MKLALVMPGGVDRSGVERVIPAYLWLIERLARRHEVHVFALRQEAKPATWELLGATVHNIGDGGTTRRLMKYFGEVHRQDRRPFDLVHAFFGWCGTSAALLGWRYRLPVVFHAAGGEFVALHHVAYGMRVNLRGRLGLRVALAGATRVTVASSPMQRLAAQCGARAERVPIGVALDRWRPRAPRPRDRSRPVRFLHIGDLRPVKDQATLLAAIGHLHDSGVPLTLDVVGLDTMGGALQRSPVAQQLAAVTRWHGVLGRTELRAVVEEADILMMSSRHEAGPIVTLEAAVAGVPTVGTAVGRIAEWAPDAAVAVPVGDASALAAAAATLVHDENRRLAIAHEAHRRALEMDADSTAATVERIYEEMIASR